MRTICRSRNETANQTEYSRKKINEQSDGCKVICLILVAAGVFFVIPFVYYLFGTSCFRLDQYMEAICTSAAALSGTMFGLSAASYAFVCGELHTEERNRPYLGRVLSHYRQELWWQFLYSLVFTFVTITVSFLCLGLAQRISAPDLYTLTFWRGRALAAYKNHQYALLSAGTLCSLCGLLISLLFMVVFNISIFKRENRYSKIALSLRNKATLQYCCPEELKKIAQRRASSDMGRNKPEQEDFEKIRNLERLLLRILKNHESNGISTAEQSQSELLQAVLAYKLETGFIRASKQSKENEIPLNMSWRSLAGSPKAQSHWSKRLKMAKHDYEQLTKKNSQPVGRCDPDEFEFVKVYGDLLCCRDSRLILSKNNKKGNRKCRKKDGKEDAKEDILLDFALRCSVKRRLLLFLLWEESFSNMDLTRISFSGADLRHTNFSGCDLTRTRFKGANCEGADFSNARMQGLYFGDSEAASVRSGQIELSYKDDDNNTWDPYKGREATCLHGATFSNADLSGAALLASPQNGTRWNPLFPFCVEEEGRDLSLEQSRGVNSEGLYCLEDVSFDNTKLYSSRFHYISFDRSGMDRALMFDSVFLWCSMQYAGLSGAAFGHSCLYWCDFHCANAENAVFAQALVFRCSFREVRLKNASFAGANLVSCSFFQAYCQNVSFRGIVQIADDLPKKLEKESMVAGELSQEYVREKHLDFRYATLSNTDFSKAEFSCVDFRHAVGSDCIFTQATCHKILADDALLSSSIFNSSRFTKGEFCRSLLRNSVFITTEFSLCHFDGTDFSNSLFEQGQRPCFIGGTMANVSFLNATGLSPYCFDHVKLEKCDFRGTGLRRSDLVNRGNQVSGCTFK